MELLKHCSTKNVQKGKNLRYCKANIHKHYTCRFHAFLIKTKKNNDNAHLYSMCQRNNGIGGQNER